jgi:hypothetical protein
VEGYADGVVFHRAAAAPHGNGLATLQHALVHLCRIVLHLQEVAVREANRAGVEPQREFRVTSHKFSAVDIRVLQLG